MKVAILSTVYPNIADFLPDFFDSLRAQDDISFDLLLANDGLFSLSYEEPFNIKVRDFSGTPASIRKQLIVWAIESKYDALIFADADDIFKSNRVSSLKKLLESGTRIVFHDLLLWSNDLVPPKSMFADRFCAGQKIGENEIINCNFLGLSNTAIQTSGVLDALQGVTEDVAAFDWAFFTRFLIMQNTQATYTDETSTLYRQYSSNIASPLDLTDEQILLSVRVKKQHYSSLIDLGGFYKDMALRFHKLNELLEISTGFYETYLEKVRSIVPVNPLWWEIALLPSEVGLEDIFKQYYIKLKANDYG